MVFLHVQAKIKRCFVFHLIQIYLSIYSELTLVLTYYGFCNSISEIQELSYGGRRWEIKSRKAMHCFLFFGSKVSTWGVWGWGCL